MKNNQEELAKGLLISIEGIDGSGKSSLCLLLKEKLAAHYSVTLTKEPGGSQLGKRLRALLLEKPVPVCNKAEFLLFACDRAQHFEEVVLPALQQGTIVISDRMADSSLVYQGYGRGLAMKELEMINTWAMNNRKPDVVFYLSLPADNAYERIAQRKAPLTSFEKEKEFIKKLENGFTTVFKNRPDVITLDATQPKETLVKIAYEACLKFLEKKK